MVFNADIDIQYDVDGFVCCCAQCLRLSSCGWYWNRADVDIQNDFDGTLSVFLFAALINQVVEVFHEGDMIWVHGFHLAILPAFLDRTVKVREIQCLCIVYRFTK